MRFQPKESEQIQQCHAVALTNAPLRGLETIQLRKQKTTCEVFLLNFHVKFSAPAVSTLKRRIYRTSSLRFQQLILAYC